MNTGYVDFLKAQTRGSAGTVATSWTSVFRQRGHPSCWCGRGRKEMKEKGIDMNDDTQVRAFAICPHAFKKTSEARPLA